MINKTASTVFAAVSIFLLAGSPNCFSQLFQKHGNKVTYHGNTFEIGNAPGDTLMEVDPQHPDQVIQVVAHHPVPLKMNGQKIYQPSGLTEKTEPFANWGRFELLVLERLSDELSKLKDGDYYLYLRNLVVDTKGHVVYYEYEGLDGKNKIPPAVKKNIDAKIEGLVHTPLFKPAIAGDQAVLARADIYVNAYRIVVAHNKVSFVPDE